MPKRKSASRTKEIQTRIRWNAKERALLAEQTGELMREQGLDMLKAVRATQARLPPGRRRKIVSLAQLPWLAASFKKQGIHRATAAAPGKWDGRATLDGVGGTANAFVDAVAEVVADVLAHPSVRAVFRGLCTKGRGRQN